MDLSRYQSMDVNILLSVVNMKLRDESGDLEEFCKRYELDAVILIGRLAERNYQYSTESNQFKSVS